MIKYFLAVDIGASSGRHILGSVQNGKLVLEEVYRFPNGMINKNGVKCWDTEELLKSVVAGLGECARIGKIPTCMAIDTWGVDFALIDADGKLVGDTVGYRDSRTDGMDRAVEQIISKDELYAHTGIQKAIINTVYQLMYLKKNKPDELFSAEHLLMIPDYLNYLLTGVIHQEYTDASTTGLLDAERGEWDLELIERLEYPTKLFGRLSMAGDTVGTLKAEIAKEIGYNLTVIHASSHDTASAVLAVPASSDRFLYISSGTWSLMGTESFTPNRTDKARKFLSDLKRLTIDYNDFPTAWALREYESFLKSDEEFMFLHVREPEEIAKFVKASGGDAKTLLISGGERMTKTAYGNASDDCVEEYNYDYYFTNDKTLEEAERDFVELLKTI